MIANVYDSNKNNADAKITRICLGRIPAEGDKFVSRNGQKGTIGQIVNQCDMPCDKWGRVVNFIQNSVSIIKRETYGQLVEVAVNEYAL